MVSNIVTFLEGCLVTAVLYLIYSSAFPGYRLPKSLPWVGLKKEIFAETRGSFRQLTGSLETISEGYKKYGQNGKCFIIPDPSSHPIIMLPHEHIQWLIEQPDDVLSHWTVREERHGIKYLSLSVDTRSTMSFLEKVVGQCLSRKLDRIQADVFDEVRKSVDDTMGVDCDAWRELNLNQMLDAIISRSTIRAFFGSSLCQDDRYSRPLKLFSIFMGIGVLLVGQLPAFIIRPFAGLMINLPIWYYRRQAVGVLTPLIKESIQQVEQTSSLEKEPNHFISRGIRAAFKTKDIGFLSDTPQYLAEQFLLLSFASIPPVVSTATNVFLDLLSSDPKYYQKIREEVASAFHSDAAWSDAASVKKLVCADSSIRESLRINPSLVRGLLREVKRDCITLPDGTVVTKGNWLGTSVRGIQLDERLYPQPEEYQPFRFSGRGELGSKIEDKVDAGQTSDRFLAFSFGRHACPGRWFNSMLLKLVLAYITLNYDVQPLPNRPVNFIVGDANIPSLTTTIKVRRRVFSSKE